VGAPSFAHFARAGTWNASATGCAERTKVVSAASLPALAKNARTGHPQHRWCTQTSSKGWATRPSGAQRFQRHDYFSDSCKSDVRGTISWDSCSPGAKLMGSVPVSSQQRHRSATTLFKRSLAANLALHSWGDFRGSCSGCCCDARQEIDRYYGDSRVPHSFALFANEWASSPPQCSGITVQCQPSV